MTPRGRLDVTGCLTVGQDGQGFLDVSTGGGLTTNEAILGDGATGKSTAVAVVTDPNSFWRSQSLVIGNRSNASLTVSNKANVDSDQIDIGTHAGVLGLLDIDNAALIVTDLVVGSGASGNLILRNGGTIESDTFTIGAFGNQNTSNSSTSVESNGELRVNDIVSVENGTLTINGGARGQGRRQDGTRDCRQHNRQRRPG